MPVAYSGAEEMSKLKVTVTSQCSWESIGSVQAFYLGSSTKLIVFFPFT